MKMQIMKRLLIPLLTATSVLFAQYKVEPAGAPPADIPASYSALLAKDGTKLLNGGKPVCEIWFRAAAPSGPKSGEDSVSIATIPHGSLMGVVKFAVQHADRRGQSVKPGVYTMRYSNYPQNGDHQGVAPQRDFVVLSPIAEDKDPAGTPAFDPLMVMSRKVSGTPHPAVFSIWKADDFKPGLEKQGENDWVLQVKVGDLPIAMIVVGKSEG
jgi:hypothetical protein